MSDEPTSPHIKHIIESSEIQDEGVVNAADPCLEKRLVRKLDMTIMPLTCALYLLAYLDRSNLGNARLQGLPEDVLGGDPTGARFDWVSSMFYLSYIIMQLPAVVTSKLFRPRIWIGIATIGWGLASTLQAVAFNFQGLLAARFFIGVFEAGFGPMIPLYFTFFYTRNEIGVRLAVWFGFAAVAGAFGGLIAYGVQHIHSPIANWRILFLVEGLPTIALGIFTLFALPDRPDTTKWLYGAQKDLAIERMSRGGMREEAGTVNKSHVFAALKDWRVYAGANANAQLLTVPPYAVAAIFMISVSYISDRIQSRGIFMSASSGLGGIGYLLLLVIPPNQGARYFAIFLCCAGTYTTIGLALSWFAHNLGSESKKAAGIPLLMIIGQCGSVLGTHVYPTSEGPRYAKGLART
ncbi:hypothetical protein FRC08_001456 [Ceratobasidium sp. 394]|nr:hypothetical protein FRC08_001456 [Ceratobasidium sp. 394]